MISIRPRPVSNYLQRILDKFDKTPHYDILGCTEFYLKDKNDPVYYNAYSYTCNRLRIKPEVIKLIRRIENFSWYGPEGCSISIPIQINKVRVIYDGDRYNTYTYVFYYEGQRYSFMQDEELVHRISSDVWKSYQPGAGWSIFLTYDECLAECVRNNLQIHNIKDYCKQIKMDISFLSMIQKYQSYV